jgi:hypothetical protein
MTVWQNRSEGELHLSELVDDDHRVTRPPCEGGKCNLLEGVEVDAVLPDARRPASLLVCERRMRAVERLDLKPHTASLVPQVARHESAHVDRLAVVRGFGSPQHQGPARSNQAGLVPVDACN